MPSKQDPLYVIWSKIKQRCLNPKHPAYANYGGRGITVCAEWSDPHSFLVFREYIHSLGSKPSPKHSLDRIDNDGNYEPGNLRWSTWSEQQKNRRPFSDEVRRKFSAGHMGHSVSEETRKKISNGRKAYWIQRNLIKKP